MSTFQILEDDENIPRFSKMNRIADHSNKHEAIAKKNHDAKGVLQPYNRIEQDTKRLKLSCSETIVPSRSDVVEKKIVQVEPPRCEPKRQEKPEIDEELLQLQKQVFNIKSKEEKGLPTAVTHAEEYQEDIWNYLMHLEEGSQKPKPNYMDKQANINWSTRTILVDWLASVADEYKLRDETFHLGINYIDRFLSRISVVREKLQLLGASAMMVAGKVEEIYPIETHEWSYLTGDSFEVRQLLKMEQLILKVLKFGMQPPTMYAFLEHMCTQCEIDEKTKHLAMFLSELVLLEGADYLGLVPSKLAAASLVLARYTLSKQPFWPDKMKKISGYTLKQLSPVVQRQNKSFRDSPLKKEQAVQTKFKREKFNKVALIRPKVLNMSEFEDGDV